MRKKVYGIVVCIWLVLLGVGVNSKESELSYRIAYDSDSTNLQEVKNEVLHRYEQLIRGVHEESELVLLLHHLDEFMWEEDMQAEWKDHQLQITIGDGAGAIVHGDLEPKQLCIPEVKTKSLIKEWFE